MSDVLTPAVSFAPPHGRPAKFQRDGGASPIIRLRRFLKSALRSYGLRCTAVVQLHQDATAAEPSPVPMEDSDVPA